MLHGYPLVQRLCGGLQAFMQQHSFNTIAEFKGARWAGGQFLWCHQRPASPLRPAPTLPPHPSPPAARAACPTLPRTKSWCGCSVRRWTQSARRAWDWPRTTTGERGVGRGAGAQCSSWVRARASTTPRALQVWRRVCGGGCFDGQQLSACAPPPAPGLLYHHDPRPPPDCMRHNAPTCTRAPACAPLRLLRCA